MRMDAAEVEQLVVRRITLALREGFSLVGNGAESRVVSVQRLRREEQVHPDSGVDFQYVLNDGAIDDPHPLSVQLATPEEAAARFVSRLGFHEANAAWALAIMRRTPAS